MTIINLDFGRRLITKINDKKVIFLAVLLFLMKAPPVYADWRKVTLSGAGDFYVDFDRIGKNGEYAYFWTRLDFLKPLETEVLSRKIYNQGDCSLFRQKTLSFAAYQQPMGKVSVQTPPENR